MLRPSAHSRRLVPTRRGLVALAVLAVGVIVLGDLAIRLAPAGTHVAAWWPAASLAVAVGVRFGRRGLPWAAELLADRIPLPATTEGASA
mgnify:CR=1 FL=1